MLRRPIFKEKEDYSILIQKGKKNTIKLKSITIILLKLKMMGMEEESSRGKEKAWNSHKDQLK